MAERQGSWVNSSYGGNGLCQENPLGSSGALRRRIARASSNRESCTQTFAPSAATPVASSA